MASIEVKGAKELARKLKRTAEVIENRAVRTALREAAKPVLAAMRSGAKSRRVKRGLRQRMQSQKGTVYAVEIGPNTKTAARAAWEEKGTARHIIEIKRKHVLSAGADGPVYGVRMEHPGTRARPFVRPAWESTKTQALSIAADYLGREISGAMRA